MKKQTVQSCGKGIMAAAWGKAMNAKPGPRSNSKQEWEENNIIAMLLAYDTDAVFCVHVMAQYATTLWIVISANSKMQWWIGM